MKLVRPFTLPRERTSPEITRAFQSVQISLENLERAIAAAPDFTGQFTKLQNALQKLQRETSRPLPEPLHAKTRQQTGGLPEITFSSEI